jgi:hypothetical protein
MCSPKERGVRPGQHPPSIRAEPGLDDLAQMLHGDADRLAGCDIKEASFAGAALVRSTRRDRPLPVGAKRGVDDEKWMLDQFRGLLALVPIPSSQAVQSVGFDVAVGGERRPAIRAELGVIDPARVAQHFLVLGIFPVFPYGHKTERHGRQRFAGRGGGDGHRETAAGHAEQRLALFRTEGNVQHGTRVRQRLAERLAGPRRPDADDVVLAAGRHVVDRPTIQITTQVVGQCLSAVVTLVRVFGQALEADRFQVAPGLRLQAGRRRRFLICDQVERFDDQLPLERGPTGQTGV